MVNTASPLDKIPRSINSDFGILSRGTFLRRGILFGITPAMFKTDLENLDFMRYFHA